MLLTNDCYKSNPHKTPISKQKFGLSYSYFLSDKVVIILWQNWSSYGTVILLDSNSLLQQQKNIKGCTDFPEEEIN